MQIKLIFTGIVWTQPRFESEGCWNCHSLWPLPLSTPATLVRSLTVFLGLWIDLNHSLILNLRLLQFAYICNFLLGCCILQSRSCAALRKSCAKSRDILALPALSTQPRTWSAPGPFATTDQLAPRVRKSTASTTADTLPTDFLPTGGPWGTARVPIPKCTARLFIAVLHAGKHGRLPEFSRSTSNGLFAATVALIGSDRLSLSLLDQFD